MKLTHLDLFSGLGAFSLGFEREGFSTIAQVEIDKNCLKLLGSKWPTVHRWNDVTTFDPDSIERPSVVTFGSPCQDLSVAGQRAGMVGERSGLFYAATRIIQRLVGRGLEFALWENVEGAFSSNGGRDFAGVLSELGRCGALDIGYRVLDCQFWGLAQRRRRVFLVADFRGRRCAEILSFESCLRGHPQTSREKGQDTSGSTGDGVARCVTAGEAERRDWETCNIISQEVAARCGHHHRRDDLDNDTYIPVTARTLAARGDSSPCIDRGMEFVAIGFTGKDHGQDALPDCSPTLRAGVHKDSHSNGGVGPAVCFQSSQSGVREVEAHPTLDSHNGSRRQNGVVGNFGVRRLTPTECERLMGLPDGWTAGFSDSVRYRMIGNSAAVPVIEWLAANIRNSLAK